jgi:Centromere DNA-binding protein complex CBF3 subunit, domain 2
METEDATDQGATAETVAELARENTAINSQRSRRVNDRTYTLEWRRYRAWVALQRQNSIIPAGPKYLTRENVDLFFSSEVVNRQVIPETARRVVSSLQRFADDEEYIDGSEVFKVGESDMVKKALETHKRLYMVRMTATVEDPHADLPTNVLSEEECLKVLRLAVSTSNWKDMTLTWTTCTQTFLRNDSIRKLHMRHLRCNSTHGPACGRDDTNNFGAGWGFADHEMITYVLDKYVHKCRSKKKEEVGAWRHKNFLNCSVGMLAMNLFMRLYADAEINFYGARVGEEMPMWWDRPLIVEWSGDTSAYDAFETLLDNAGLNWAKVTHLRKLGIEQASALGGLASNQTSTMSKHKAEKGKMAVYETQIARPVCSVMAGFTKEGCYFVARSRLFPHEQLRQLVFPNGLVPSDQFEAATWLIFPNSRRWRQEQRSPAGDKSECAENFLFSTLRLLAVTVIQDGIYWLREFPNHVVTLRLLHAMPPWYPGWAAWARQQCRRMEAGRVNQRMQSAGDGFIAGVNVLRQSFDARFDAYEAELRRLEQQRIEREQQRERARQDWEAQQLQRFQVWETRLFQQVPPQHLLLGPPHLPTQAPPAPHLPPQAPLPLQAPPRAPQRTINQVLRNIPHIPPLPREIPKTLRSVLAEHQSFDLSSYVCSHRTGWPQNIQISFSKRMKLYKVIEDKAIQLRGAGRGPNNEAALINAAVALDIERVSARQTVDQFYRMSRLNDPNRQSRGPRRT